jgi:alkylated DNA nucleotide flippase Atl1
MSKAATAASFKRDILEIAARVPAGRVATHGQIGRHLNVAPPFVASVLAMLDERERETTPWWRIVADGGAIGRNPRRDDHVARLQAEGVLVSPAGIVQDIASRRMGSLDAPRPGVQPRADQAIPVQGRARGMKDKPASSL